jgi:hypothetical protein
MNIFYVDRDPVIAAQQLVDKHVVKMPLETAQLLCSAFPQGEAPYRRTHYNHPSAVWTRRSRANYEWVIKHGLALCEEYTKRYGKQHKSNIVILWCRDNIDKLEWGEDFFTDPPECMPDECKTGTVTESYRQYYRKYKSYIYRWTKSDKPEWA